METLEARRNFRRQIESLLPPLAQTARYILNDEPAADDLVAATVEEAYRRYPGGLDDQEFRQWMFARMMSEAGAVCRTDQAGIADKDAGAVEHSHATDEVVEPDRLRRLEKKLQTEVQTSDIREAVSAIPYPIRTVLVLSLVADFPSREISTVLGTLPATVKGQLRSGRRLLREALCEQVLGPSPSQERLVRRGTERGNRDAGTNRGSEPGQ